MRTLIFITLSLNFIPIMGCIKTGEVSPTYNTDIEGYVEVSEMPCMVVTCGVFALEEYGYDNTLYPYRFIIKQFPLEDCCDMSYVTEADHLSIRNTGRRILIANEGDGGTYSLSIMEKVRGTWEKKDLDLVIPAGADTPGLAVSPDGNWGLVTYFEALSERYGGESAPGVSYYEKPYTVFYSINFIDNSFEELDIGRHLGLIVTNITKDKILFSKCVDMVGYGGEISTWPIEKQTMDIAKKGANRDFFLYLPTFFYDMEFLPTYTDNGEFRVFFKEGNELVYKSFKGEYEPTEILFRTNLRFIQAGTDRNGEKIVGIIKREGKGNYELYYIDIINKTYSKYGFQADDNIIDKTVLIEITDM